MLEIIRSESEIIDSWNKKYKEPLVSICCITFNHEKYIENAINSFLNQRTDFPIEILIHDDCSTDNTTNIIKRYERNYPNIIKGIYQKENQFSKGIKDFFMRMFPLCKGKYITTIEGDDYWNDNKKLQIQAEFLNNNPEYVLSAHSEKTINEKNELETKDRYKNFKEVYSKDELKKLKVYFHTSTRMFRNIPFSKTQEQIVIPNGDIFFISRLAEYGKAYFHKEIKPNYYRIHSGGVFSKTTQFDQITNLSLNRLYISKYYLRNNDIETANYFFDESIKYLARERSVFSILKILLINDFKMRIKIFIKKILKSLKDN